MKDKLEGYKFNGEVESYQPIGSDLKAAHEIEIADLSNPEEVENMINYLTELDEDQNLKALQKAKHPKMSVQQKVDMAMQDPAGTFIVRDGKKISLAQYMKNSKSMNVRKNFDFQSEDSNNSPSGKKYSPNGDNNSMMQNSKKVK